MATIRFFFPYNKFTLSRRTELKEFIQFLFKKEKKKLSSLNYIFCSDEYLLQINQQFLKHDSYTDIITFPLNEPGAPIEGEIYLSIERVRENALNQGITFTNELHRVILHGALHLCGYKDKLKDDKLTMRKMEDRYLELYFGKK